MVWGVSVYDIGIEWSVPEGWLRAVEGVWRETIYYIPPRLHLGDPNLL